MRGVNYKYGNNHRYGFNGWVIMKKIHNLLAFGVVILIYLTIAYIIWVLCNVMGAALFLIVVLLTVLSFVILELSE